MREDVDEGIEALEEPGIRALVDDGVVEEALEGGVSEIDDFYCHLQMKNQDSIFELHVKSRKWRHKYSEIFKTLSMSVSTFSPELIASFMDDLSTKKCYAFAF